MIATIRYSTAYIIGLLWILYTLYLGIIKHIHLFSNEYLEMLVVAGIQILIYIIMMTLFNKKCILAIQLSSFTSCGLVILWHYSFLSYLITRSTIIGLFLVSDLVLVAILYARKKTFYKDSEVSILKQLGIVLISSVANIIGAIFTFYVVHYWI